METRLMELLRRLVLELNLPEPDYGLAVAPGLTLLLAYPDEGVGVAAAPAPAAPAGWRLFPGDPADPESLRAALVALAGALGYDLPAPGLTAQQQAAVMHTGGPARILAGAGTGKTRVVVARFHHLVRQGVAPDRILALTFSREAARKMRDEILPGLRAGAGLWVSTFHSFCLKVLESEAPAGLRLVQEPESRALLAGVCRGQPWAWYTGALAGRLVDDALTLIGQAKDYLLTPDDVARYAARQGDHRLGDLALAYRLFQAELAGQQAAEFSDFIYKAVDLLERDPAVAARWQNRFDHILVDEFQDTNLAQFRVLQILARGHGNLVVVGDDDQAIYHFRGATDRFMIRFHHYYPGAADFPVVQNFRCPDPVLQAANRLIRHNAGRVDKALYTTTKLDGCRPVQHWEARSEQDEAAAVAAEIAGRVRRGEYRPGDFAILCRSVRRSAGEFALALDRLGVPYRLVGEEREHPVVAQTLALLRLTRSPGLPDLLPVLAGRLPPADLFGAVRTAGGDPARLLAADPGLQAWLNTWGARHRHAPDVLTYAALRFMGHLRLSLAPGVAEADGLAAARALQERAARAPDLDHLLAPGAAYPAQVSGNDVSIMTVHAAKGLQFPVVFVVGLAEGRFPVAVDNAPVFYHAAAIRDWLDGEPPAAADAAWRLAQHLREERRLAYVALTRAEEELILTRARQYGQEAADPSRFLAELGAPAPVDASARLAGPAPAARAYLVRVAAARETPDRERVVQAVRDLAADPGAVPLRRQAAPAPFAGGETLRLSATALEAYRDCPRRYYSGQVLGLPEEDSIYLAFGSAVHGALEQFNRARQAGPAPDWPQLEAWWAGALAPDRCETAGQHRQLLERGRLFLRRYHGWVLAHPQDVLAVEQPFAFDYTDGQGRTHRVRGRYDLVARGPDGIEIIDYKTGDRKSTGVNKRYTAGSPNNPDRKLQLALYYLAYFGGQVDPGARVTYVFLRHPEDQAPDQFVGTFDQKGEQVISCRHSRESLAAVRADIDGVIDGILANRFARDPEDRKCAYCPFRRPCEVTDHEWF